MILTALIVGIAAALGVFLLAVFLGDSLQMWAADFFYKAGEQFTNADGRVFQVAVFEKGKFYTIISVLCGTIAFCWMLSLKLTQKRTQTVSQKQIVREITDLLEAPSADSCPEYRDIEQKFQTLQDAFGHKQQLLKAESARKDDLVAYLAHDLKTPLTSVVGYLELLIDAPDMPAEQKIKYTHVALDKAYRLENLISEFFEITRYNLHDILREWETIDLAFLTIQLKEEFYPLLKQKNNTVNLQIPDGLSVYADRNKLGRVLSNIMKNAIAYSYPNSPISVNAVKTQSDTIITVTNRGKTIPKQKLGHIFEKFYRLDEARNSNSGGAGLGLAIAKEIIAAHGGVLRAESEDEVTSFVIQLPNLKNSLGES